MRLPLLSSVFLLAAFVSAAQGEVRKWTEKSGERSFQAEFVELAGDQVVLKGEDGKSIRLALEKLSAADQEFVREKTAILPGSVPQAKAGEAPSASGHEETTLDLGGGVAIRLVLVPAGKFMMGSPEKEVVREHLHDENQHEVTLSKPFYLGATHVTVDQFAVFVQKTGYKTDAEREGGGPTWRNPGIPQKSDHPAVCMSFNDAKAFCDWLTKAQAKNCHLPSEAQWEYACRAGTTTAYCWGDNPADGKAWACWAAPKTGTVPAGSLKPNPWGLYDMHGNALQWCSDCYGPYAKEPVTDPTGPAAPFPYDLSGGRNHVLRGGAWHLAPADCRSAYRQWGPVDHRFSSLGFRVCVDVP